MVGLARASALFVIVLVLSMTLPKVFARATSVKVHTPILYYSPVLERFVMPREAVYEDEYGGILSFREFRRALPFIYHADLAKWGEFPSHVGGVAVNANRVASRMQFVRISPRDIDAPKFGMHMLLESQPEGASLEYPPDMFLLGQGIEFLRCEDNSSDQEKSARFTQAMLDAGFVFPARNVGGNPDARKAFDWGYFLVDDTNTLFHLMMVNGEPRCINTGRAFRENVRAITVSEKPRKEFYGTVVTDESVYLVSCRDYELIRLPLVEYDPGRDTVMLLATPLNHVVQQRTQDHVFATATDNEWVPIAQTVAKVDRSARILRDKAISVFLPFQLEVSSKYSKFKQFRLKNVYRYPWWTLSGVALCLVVYGVLHRRRFHANPSLPDMVFLAATGLYGLIALVAVGGVRKKRMS